MYADAEAQLEELRHRNEFDGVLFKVRDDPRITPIGRFLRTYSLDELPQLVRGADVAVVAVGSCQAGGAGPRLVPAGRGVRTGSGSVQSCTIRAAVSGIDTPCCWEVSSSASKASAALMPLRAMSMPCAW